MGEPARVLIVDDEPLMRIPLRDRLRREGYHVDAAATGEEAIEHLARGDYDVAVVDLRLPGVDGIEVLTRARALGRTADVVMITAHGTIETAVTAMKIGARDYLIKPFETAALLEVIARYVALRRAATDDEGPATATEFQGLVGASPPMAKLHRMVRAAAGSRATIILRGETGTGKELVARAVHALSARASGPFVAINCASIPETLFEAELFGAERGAFTGADRRRKGRFELADGGTLFLDEIDEMAMAPQAKLLRALQERVIERLGSAEAVAVDVRVVAATKVDLAERVAGQRFREDLFHRLNVLPIALPPLRERGTDVLLLANHFLARHGADAGKVRLQFSEAALAWLSAQRFPGNVRELSNLVARAVALCSGATVEPWHLCAELDPSGPEASDAGASTQSLADAVRASEYRRIQEALVESGGHKARAAEILGISRKTLWEKLRRGP